MPSNSDFTLRILVGDTPLPEYTSGDICYVESNLFTPYSYQQQQHEVINGENESQSWPVTPFVIAIKASPSCPNSYYRVFVDGQLVKKLSVAPLQTRVVEGFRDGAVVKEFLFSLPRFSRGEDDQLSVEQASRVGLIEVECYDAKYVKSFVSPTARHKRLTFDQANKKDCYAATRGQHLMATTKAGKIIKERASNKIHYTDHWFVKSLRSKLSVKYVTAQTITDVLGLSVVPIPFPEIPGRQVNIATTRSNVRTKTKTVTSESDQRSQSDLLDIKIVKVERGEMKNEIIDLTTE